MSSCRLGTSGGNPASCESSDAAKPAADTPEIAAPLDAAELSRQPDHVTSLFYQSPSFTIVICRMNLRAIDLNLLPVFEAVFTEGGITRAAERLNLTQPAVSNALARLRGAFGDQLSCAPPAAWAPPPPPRR